MRTGNVMTILALAALAAACSEPNSSEGAADQSQLIATGTMADAEGVEVGTVELSRADSVLSLSVTLAGLEAGTRAIHLHTTGACDAPDFASAGGHLNPSGATHGSMSEGGKHLGDLPNIELPDGGQFEQTINLEGDTNSILSAIFDEDGTAVMIHAGPDDYMSDPAGAAGPRIACAVLRKTS